MNRLSTRLGLTGLAAALAVGAGVATASATMLRAHTAPGSPGPGHVLLGVGAADPTAFDRQTGHHHDVWLLFDMLGGSWVHWNGIATQISRATAQHRTALITLSAIQVAPRKVLSPQALARGAADAVYLSYSRQANAAGVPVWFRPMQEMNGYWSPSCAFNADGTRRGAAYSTAEFRAAFRRIAIILRGGTAAQLDARLHGAGLRPLQAALGEAGITPSGLVGIVWNPQGQGAPNVRGNQPRDYYPGPAFVDYVADDLYAQGGHAYWPGMNALYAYGKPFVVGEWAPWGTDDAAFVKQMFAWVHNHPRTAAMVYYDEQPATFGLGSKPRALAAYRAAARLPRFAGAG